MYSDNYKHKQANGEDVFFIPRSIENLSDEFNAKIYDYLPSVLSRACNLFEDRKEKDIILLGALSVISGCLPNIYGTYDRRKVFPHLFVFVVAPAGSGKGMLQWTRKLAEDIHRELREFSRQSRKNYEADMKESSASQKKKGQLFKLIPDTENGLFSRFAFYSFPAVPILRDVFRDTGHDTETVFNSLGRIIYDYRKCLLQFDSEIEWQFSKQDQEDFRNIFSRAMKTLYNETVEQSLMSFYNSLPDSFDRSDARKITESMNISQATYGRYLISGLFRKTSHARYEKMLVQNEQMSN
ncbi:MAG: DUF3987 domain-containing protein [Bacteroidia bacterium]|nr:DUF3987 domain-containing protein [Bacteroidia bacterium]